MNKLLSLFFLGFCIHLIAMDPPEGHKQKQREALGLPSKSSGSVAQMTSTSIVSTSGTSSDSSSDRAEIDLDREGHAMSKKQKRRSVLVVNTATISHDDNLLYAQIIQLLEQKRKEDEEKHVRAPQMEQEKPKARPVFLQSKVPQLNLSDIEAQRKGDLQEEELKYILSFIGEATKRNIEPVQERLKERIRKVHATPPASPLFTDESFKERFQAITQVRQLANDHHLTAHGITTLRNRRPDTPQEICPANPSEIIASTGFKGLQALLDLIEEEKDNKLVETGASRNWYRRGTILSALVNAGALAWAIYSQIHGHSSDTSTSAPCNGTLG